jgi:transmembrane sensor
MTELERLIKGYWDGTLTRGEREQLFELLGEYSIEEDSESYADYIRLLQQSPAEENRKDAHFQEEWNRLRSSIEVAGPATMRSRWAILRDAAPTRLWRRMSYAAAIALVVVAGWWWIRSSGTRTDAVLKQESAVREVVYTNKHSAILDTVLPDGSAVELYPGATLRFERNFDSIQRDVHMDGRIVFRVGKEAGKPFTVFAGRFSTTVLGTQFEVNTAGAGTFTVKLSQGKVVVRSMAEGAAPMSDVYLQPGELLTYDLQKKKSVVEKDELRPAAKPGDEKRQHRAAIPELSFTDIPLSILFKQLEAEYGVIIQCDTKLIEDKVYTGTFFKTDNPKKILKRIIKPYHLDLHEEDNTFIIVQP